MPVDKENVVIRLAGGTIGLSQIKRYSIQSEYMAPYDRFEFEVFDQANHERLFWAVRPWQTVEIYINDHLQLIGRIEKSDIDDSGVIHVSGYDYRYNLVASHIDVEIARFKTGDSIKSAILRALKPLGIFELVETNNTWRNIQTGYPGFKGSLIDNPANAKLRDSKPMQNDGAWECVSRLAALHGYLLLPTNEPSKLAICQPEYRQSPMWTINRDWTGSNVVSANVSRDYENVPTFTAVKGKVGQANDRFVDANKSLSTFGDESYSKLGKNAEIKAIAYATSGTDATIIDFRWNPQNASPNNGGLIYRPMFISARDFKTQAEMDKGIKRLVSDRLKETLIAEYTMPGHTQNNYVFAVDTIAQVNDAVGMVFEPMWVMSRVLEGGPSGQTTILRLIRKESFRV